MDCRTGTWKASKYTNIAYRYDKELWRAMIFKIQKEYREVSS